MEQQSAQTHTQQNATPQENMKQRNTANNGKRNNNIYNIECMCPRQFDNYKSFLIHLANAFEFIPIERDIVLQYYYRTCDSSMSLNTTKGYKRLQAYLKLCRLVKTK